MRQPFWNFEQDPAEAALDDTSFNLHAYFDRTDDARLRQYPPQRSDAQVMTWGDNFNSDGDLMLPCSERDVDITECRRMLEQSLRYRARVRS